MSSQRITRFLKDRRPVIYGNASASQSSSSQPQDDDSSSLFVTPNASFTADESPAPSPAQAPVAVMVAEAASPQPSTPTREVTPSRGVKFDINFAEIWVQHKRCTNARLKPPNRRASTREASWVWQHGAQLQCDQHPTLFVCKICHLARKYSYGVYVASSTHGAANHLQKDHHIDAPESSKRHSQAPPHCPTCGNQQDQTIDALVYRQLVVDWVIAHNLSFEVGVASDTRLLIGQNPFIRDTLPSSSTTLSTYVLDSYKAREAVVLEAILTAKSKINLTFDGWKAPNHVNYVGIVAHFLDEEYAHQNVLIGLPRIIGSKTGENEAAVIVPVLDRCCINSANLGVTTSDNAADNTAAMVGIARRLGMPLEWAEEARLRCIAHITNLVVKSLLFGTKESKINRELEHSGADEAFEVWKQLGPIGKLHNICTYINRNDERRQAFRECQTGKDDVEDIPVLNLIQDGGIRWHSTNDMIERGR